MVLQKLKNFYKKSYFKTRIIVTFALITITLILVAFQTSYQLARKIYLDQLSSHVITVSALIGGSVETKYLTLLNPDSKTNAATIFYRDFLKKNSSNAQIHSAFIFNGNYQILAHTDSAKTGTTDPQLMLSRKEIAETIVGKSSSSLPFKGEDGQWYMWGFYKLTDSYWLGIQENAEKLSQIENLITFFFWIGFGGIILTIIAGLFLVNTILKPVHTLAGFSQALGKGDFNAKRPENIEGELEPLATALDTMRSDLAAVQKEKESMLAQIAHEIRNPLGSVELLAGLIKEDHSLSEKNLNFISRIIQEIIGLKSLISAYLNYSRPLSPNSEKVFLPDVLSQIKDIVTISLERKNIRLILSDTETTIDFDPVHLRQIILNLISNSIEAIENSDGEIEISAIQINKAIHISVKDNGPGIKTESANQIFKPFFTTKENGTGLGLAISKKLCEENQASLLLFSNGSLGCTFTIIKEINHANN